MTLFDLVMLLNRWDSPILFYYSIAPKVDAGGMAVVVEPSHW